MTLNLAVVAILNLILAQDTILLFQVLSCVIILLDTGATSFCYRDGTNDG